MIDFPKSQQCEVRWMTFQLLVQRMDLKRRKRKCLKSPDVLIQETRVARSQLNDGDAGEGPFAAR